MNEDGMWRRQFLISVGTVLPLAGLVGCLGEQPGTSVSFEAAHGPTQSGTLYGDGECGIVLVPQINMDRESWQPQAELLASEDHTVLAIDEDPDNRSASVRGAIRYLRDEQSVTRLVLIGASSGGEAVVTANANATEPVDGTIAISPGGGVESASELHNQLLVVVSREDDDRFVRTAEQLHRNAPQPKELVEYTGDSHGQRLFESDHEEDLKQKIREFVNTACSEQ